MKTVSFPHRPRRGAAVVELALALPVLFLLIFGAIEFGRVNMVRNTLKNAVFEGARRASIPGATSDVTRDAVAEVLKIAGVRKATITIEPSQITEKTTRVVVSVSAPMKENAWVMPYFTAKTTLTQSCTLDREYASP
jgi:Flp pilus assembly protein TadG